MIFSCRKEDSVKWKTLDRKVGKIEFELNALPERCGFVRYDIELEVYDTEEPYDEALACVPGDGPWRTHSKRILHNRYCRNCTGSSSRDCFRVSLLFFFLSAVEILMEFAPVSDLLGGVQIRLPRMVQDQGHAESRRRLETVPKI